MATIRISRNLGLLLTGVFLMLFGVLNLFKLMNETWATVLAILALVAGVLVIIEYKD